MKRVHTWPESVFCLIYVNLRLDYLSCSAFPSLAGITSGCFYIWRKQKSNLGVIVRQMSLFVQPCWACSNETINGELQ